MGIIQKLKNKNALSILKSLEKAKMIKLLSVENRSTNSLLHLKGAISEARVIELIDKIDNTPQKKKI